MSKSEELGKLNNLLDMIKGKEMLSINRKNAETELNEALKLRPEKLRKFDDVNRKAYKYSQAGTMPGRPSALIMGYRDIYSDYLMKVCQYEEALNQADKKYFIVFNEERTQIHNDEIAEIEKVQQEKRVAVDNIDTKMEELNARFDDDDTLGGEYKNEEYIRKLKKYFDNGCVDSIKEAAMTMRDDEFRRQQLEIENSKREDIKEIKKLYQELKSFVTDKMEDIVDTMDTIYSLTYETRDEMDYIRRDVDSIRSDVSDMSDTVEYTSNSINGMTWNYQC